MREKKPTVITISQQVYQIIKEEIIAGVYKPGDWLQEKELAGKLQVSRSPVREALRQLLADGLVTEIPNKGIFVRSLSPKEITEIFEVRKMMEGNAVLSLKGKLTDREKEELTGYRDDFIRLHKENDLERYIQVDSAFHRYLIQCSGNSILNELYRKVRYMTMMFRIFSLSTKERFDESQQEHVDIINCLLADEMEKAEQINNRHLALARDTAIEHIPFEKDESL